MKETERGYQFESTGREFYANGYIGINPDLAIAEGHDGYIDPEGTVYIDPDDVAENSLTPGEVDELGIYMIELWTKFMKAYGTKCG